MKHSYSTGSFEIVYTYTMGRAQTWTDPAEDPQLDVEEVWVVDDDRERLVDINPLLTNAGFKQLFGMHVFDRLVVEANKAKEDERAAAAEYRRDLREDR